MGYFLKTIFIAKLLAWSTFLFGQHADCDKMLPLKDTLYHSNTIIGYGDQLEFTNSSEKKCHIFEKEENSIWYLITVPDSGDFSFDILPEKASDDWDFLLYEHKKKFCKRITDNKIAPIRSNLSRSAKTGTASNANSKFVGPGINENYSQSVVAKKGGQYVLVINNPKKSGKRHTLKLHFTKNRPSPIAEKEVPQKKEVSTLLLKLEFKDKEHTNPLPSNVNITGVRKDVIELKDISEFETNVSRKNRLVFINASSKGYMLTSSELKLKTKKTELNLTILLEPIIKGKKVNLKKIQFFGNRADFLPTAKGSLLSLLDFMKINESVKIKIEGHVNGPGQRNSKDYKELSDKRAKAVKTYLVENGIDQNRISFEGYGNSKMIHPHPKNETQMSENRRVEIKITSI